MDRFPESLHQLSTFLNEGGFAHVLVGGWAVNFHGHSRNTVDIDFLLPNSERSRAEAFFSSAGYQLVHQVPMVSRFQKLETQLEAVDLMWTPDDSFESIIQRAVSSQPLVVALSELLAMKLYALQANEDRSGRDLLDIRELLKNNDRDISTTQWYSLVERYAPQEFQTELKKLR